MTTYSSLEPVPIMMPFCLGVPITAGKTDLGESSPAMPVLQRPDPLSMTTADLVAMMGARGEDEEGER